MEHQATTTPTVARLEHLQGMLLKYRDAYYSDIDRGRDLSSRMYRWIDEYDAARFMPGWDEFCKKHCLATSHTAIDNLA